MHDFEDVNQHARKTAVCTLFEGDYHLGLAAFTNSLVHAGFTGTIWAGYRGKLPPWLDQLKSLGGASDEYMVTDQVRLVFFPLTTSVHLTNYKPQFMLDLLAHHALGCEYLWYFDPDICLRSSWSFFADWQRHGIALCQEIVNNILPVNSPLRLQWVDIAASIGVNGPSALNHYYNGGMVGVPSSHAGFLDLWRRLLEYAETTGCDLGVLMPGNRESPFHASDQDALNIAAMYSKVPLSTLGPEGMGFIPGGVRMYHCVGQKPWRGSALLRALAGTPPSNAMKFFFTQVSSPICAYSALNLHAKRLECSIAAFIGRFYSRR
jgi:hypothetical protein